MGAVGSRCGDWMRVVAGIDVKVVFFDAIDLVDGSVGFLLAVWSRLL